MILCVQGRLRLDTFLLRENDITVLTPGAFLNFEYINYTRYYKFGTFQVASGWRQEPKKVSENRKTKKIHSI